MQEQTTVVPARMDGLRLLKAFAQAFCNKSGVSRECYLHLNLVLDELFTNTVCHGHAGGSEEPVWVSLSWATGAIHIGLEDTAPAYNPFARNVTTASPAESGQVGGLGLRLARSFVTSFDYAYVFGRNRLRLRMETETGQRLPV